jgi:predicted RNase H-like nuclease (RuvC/YqgF family)
MRKRLLLGLLLINVTAGYAQYSLPFFQNEYKEKYEEEVRHSTRLTLNVRMLSDSLRQLNLINSQLETRINQLESNRKKLEGRILAYSRDNKRMQVQVATLKNDTLRLNRELADLSQELKQVERTGMQRSAYLEKQIFVLKDSLSINSNLYRKTSQELSRIHTLVSYMKLGDVEFDIPSGQFINVLHSAILTGNTTIVLRTSYQGEAILFFDMGVRKRKLIGHRMVPYHLEAYVSFSPHPLETERKTVASVKTRTYTFEKGNRVESTDFGDTELVKAKFYKELDKLHYSHESTPPTNTGTSLSSALRSQF